MKKIMNLLIILIMVLCVKVVNADTNVKIGDTKSFANDSCEITNCVAKNDKVSVTFDSKECKFTGVKKGESVINVTCSNGQKKEINVNIRKEDFIETNSGSGEYDNVGNLNTPDSPEAVCSPLGKLKDDIQGIFNIFKIVAPILVIVMSVFDFVKAAVGKVDGDLKKAFQKLIKRILFAVILFFLPIVLDWVLGLVDPGYNTCINVK